MWNISGKQCHSCVTTSSRFYFRVIHSHSENENKTSSWNLLEFTNAVTHSERICSVNNPKTDKRRLSFQIEKAETRTGKAIRMLAGIHIMPNLAVIHHDMIAYLLVSLDHNIRNLQAFWDFLFLHVYFVLRLDVGKQWLTVALRNTWQYECLTQLFCAAKICDLQPMKPPI